MNVWVSQRKPGSGNISELIILKSVILKNVLYLHSQVPFISIMLHISSTDFATLKFNVINFKDIPCKGYDLYAQVQLCNMCYYVL